MKIKQHKNKHISLEHFGLYFHNHLISHFTNCVFYSVNTLCYCPVFLSIYIIHLYIKLVTDKGEEGLMIMSYQI